jgi:uncharacterized protein
LYNKIEVINPLVLPPIDVRERISFEFINALAFQIAEKFKPVKIVLFGSYAYGNPTPESDIDLMVIMDTPIRPSVKVQQIREYLEPLFGLDLVVYTPTVLAKRLEWGDSFLQEIISKGILLYESTDV